MTSSDAPAFVIRDPDWEARARAAFAAQGLMRTAGAEILSAAPGMVELAAPILPGMTQHHGFAHAGLTFALGDTAAGFAAQSLMAPGDGVLTVEMKINLLAPGRGDRLRAVGRVERAGRSITVVRAEVFAEADGAATPAAILQGTMMTMRAMG